MSSSRLLVTVILVLMLAPVVLFAHATSPSYVAGVKMGDYATYTPLKVIFKSSGVLTTPEPQPIKDLNNTVYDIVTVSSVSLQTNVTANDYSLYKNGTASAKLLAGDLENGHGNLTFGILAGGLSQPDPIWNAPSAPTINQTVSMSYLGTSRSVNILNMTKVYSAPGFSGRSMTYFVWDQASGVILEVISDGTSTSPIGSLEEHIHVAVTATNIFSPSPNFFITANPLSLSLAAGSSGSSTVTVGSLYGFSGTVELSTSVNATGLTASCATLNPISSYYPQSSACTLSASTIGAYNVTITGTAGTLTHSVSVIVTVTPAPNFSLATDTTSITLLAGATGRIGVTVSAENGFTGTVVLSATISPSTGLACTLSSTSVTLTSTETSATSNVSCSGVYWGYTVTVKGTSGTLSNQASGVSVKVQDYTLDLSSSSISTNTGTAGTATITVTSHDGFNGAVSLSSTVNTSGLTCTFTPTSLASGSGTSTLSCTGSPGTYSVTVSTTSGSLSHSTPVRVTVTSVQQTPSQPATILGLAPAIFYGIIAFIMILAAAVTTTVLRTRSKPASASAAVPANPTSP